LRDNDQQFFDSFMLVLGILIGVAIGLFFLARVISLHTVAKFELDDPLVQQQIEQRIQPLGHVVLLGGEELAAQQAALAAAAAPKANAKKLTGPEVFEQVCYACHAPPGAGGAPVLGNAEMWNPRIAKGLMTLEQHALMGFQGEKGFMPPKGGRVDLSDEEIVAAVHYMVGKVQPDAVKSSDASAAGSAAPSSDADGAAQ
jgi:cytochrome c5